MKSISPVAQNLSLSWREGFHKFYEFWIRPHSVSEDSARKELVVNVILFGTIFFLTVLEIFLIYQQFLPNAIQINNAPYFFSFVYLVFIGLYILSRSGRFKTSAYLLVIVYTLANSYAAWHWGPDLYQVIIIYALIIVTAGIVINARFSFFITLSIAILIILSNYLDLHGVITFNRYWRTENLEVNDTIEIVLSYCMIAFIAWLSNREIDRSLNRAHRSEKALRERNESLEEIVEERTKELKRLQLEKMTELYRFVEFGRLSSGIFHDLMNPLTVLTANIHHLDKIDHPELRRVKEYVDRSLSASKRMERFISSAKKQIQNSDFAQIFCLNDEIEETIDLFNYRSMKERIPIEFQATEHIKLFGNPIRFHQIMANLISNGLDSYTSIRKQNSIHSLVIKMRKNANYIEISVMDKGAGIEESNQGKIFEPFFSTKGSEKGLGIGLSSTKEFIEKYFDGSIHVKSHKNEGTTFTIRLPVPLNSEQ